MPNPVVSFEIGGPDIEALRTFYAETFGWELFALPGGYTLVDTSEHIHGDDESMTYTGADANRNDGVVVGSMFGQPAWKFSGESQWRTFEPGVAGGIAHATARVTVYIQVRDLEAMLNRVEANGGEVVRPPEEVAPGVFIAAFGDPAGNEIGLIRSPR
jgi:predicted enzyme related to lactoylglutathione lyase